MRIIISLLILMVSTIAYSQSIDDADRLYNDGEYNRAKVIYVKYKKSNKNIATKYENCLNLQALYTNAEDFYKQQKYKKSIAVCDKILKVNPVCKKTNNLKGQCQDAIAALQKERSDLFEQARSEMSITKLNAFIEKYSAQQEWVEKANRLSEDISLYQKAKQLNTRQAFEDYLAQSDLKAYQNEANYQIGWFDSEALWNRISGSRDISDYELYLKKFSVYEVHNSEANKHINFLTGLSDAKIGSWESAYQCLSRAKTDQMPFTKDDLKLFQTATEVHEYNVTDNTIPALERYMDRYPKSIMFDTASGRVARLRADQLRWYSKNKERSKAMSYAKTDQDKAYVQNVLDYTLHEKHRINRMNYGPKLTVGIMVNGGISFDKTYNFGVGLNMRIGRYNQWVNGIVGARYELYNTSAQYDNYYKDSPKFNVLAHQLVFPVGFRFNAPRLGRNASMYFGATADFVLPIIGSNIEGVGNTLKKYYIAYTPTIGFHGRRWDWNIYYSIYPQGPFLSIDECPELEYIQMYDSKILNNKGYFGSALTIYF